MKTEGTHMTITSNGTPAAVAPVSADDDPSAEELSGLRRNLAEWHGKKLIDRDGEKIGKLEEVYVDVESDEPMFGTVKEGHFGRHLTFVPLRGITIGPDYLQVAVSREQVKDAPNLELQGAELAQGDESDLYHHYKLNYTPPETESGRRLARR
jgi:hypothetical protein